MTFTDLSDEELYRIASKGNEEAYNCLVNRLLKYAVGITFNTLSQLTLRGYDTCEASSIADQSVLVAISRYEYGSPIRPYFRAIYSRELAKSIDEYTTDLFARYSVELDESCYESERYNKYEFVSGSSNEDPRVNYELNELRVILNEENENESKLNQKQRRALLLKMQGYSLNEIAKTLKISSHQVRRLLEKDDEGTPLQEIKIRLK